MWWAAGRVFKSPQRWEAEVARQQAGLPPHFQNRVRDHGEAADTLKPCKEQFEDRFKSYLETDLLIELANTSMDCPKRMSSPFLGI